MKISFRFIISFLFYLNLGFPVYSIPNFKTQDNFNKHNNDLINIHQKNTTKSINEKSNLEISKKIYENNFIKELTKKSYPSRKIENTQLAKDSLFTTFKGNFKDLSSTYVSPFGYPIKRAPDESLINCQSKECFE